MAVLGRRFHDDTIRASVELNLLAILFLEVRSSDPPEIEGIPSSLGGGVSEASEPRTNKPWQPRNLPCDYRSARPAGTVSHSER
jgi:hypothetical protein